MKHTPGPWEEDRNYLTHGGWVIRRNGIVICAMAQQITHKVGEVPANARLIAQAPDLNRLAEHIAAMEGDTYLDGHPEWQEILAEAKDILANL